MSFYRAIDRALYDDERRPLSSKVAESLGFRPSHNPPTLLPQSSDKPTKDGSCG